MFMDLFENFKYIDCFCFMSTFSASRHKPVAKISTGYIALLENVTGISIPMSRPCDARLMVYPIA